MIHIDSDFERDGFVVLPAIFDADEIRQFIAALDSALARADNGVLRSSRAIYGARNLFQIWPDVVTAWRKPALVDFALRVLGLEAGLVRGLYFDKPPEQSWTLPPHRDMTIAVQSHHEVGPSFSHPTTKAGVPHVEAPIAVLERMLTFRIHLDPMTADNGPLTLIPGSHLAEESRPAVTPLGGAGDVLAMRPLVVHSSRHSSPECSSHRRIVHLEFAGMRELPEGMKWHDYFAI